MDASKIFTIYLACIIDLLQISSIRSGALQLTQENYQQTLDNNKVVLINFYADWCMFSQQLEPILHQTADILHEEYPNVKIARLDCEREIPLALTNSIAKYPTIKLFRNGKALRKEYRGSRSVNAFSAYIKQQLKPPVVDVLEPEDLKFDEERNSFVGYFTAKDNEAYKVFQQLADEVFESVDCYACLGVESFGKELEKGENLVYKPKKSMGEGADYHGSITDLHTMRQWLNDKANPLVREITFDNGEELTEEGLPFLLLFYKPGDTESIKRYTKGIERELLHEKANINFLTADGTTFSHPLAHIGKSESDMPVVCVDSFRHMYVFKKFSDVDVPGKLKKFIEDLHSGKLHHDFHNPPAEEETVQEIPALMPETTTTTPIPMPEKVVVALGDVPVVREPIPEEEKLSEKAPEKLVTKETKEKDQREEPELEIDSDSESGAEKTSPPETIFQKLGPSENRYTLLHWRDYSGNYRDEL